MYLFDTNIFLEILLDQKKADACRSALTLATPETCGWMTSFSTHALEVIMEGAGKKEGLEAFLASHAQDRSMMRYETSIDEELEIVRLMKEIPLDFDDTLQFYVARKKKLTLVTLDRDFEKVSGIEVKYP